MANYNDLKARYSHVLDRLSDLDDAQLAAVSDTLDSVAVNVENLEAFVTQEVGSVIPQDDVVEESVVEEFPSDDFGVGV